LAYVRGGWVLPTAAGSIIPPAARKTDDAMLTEWQIYRMFDARRGAWSTFQFLVRQRLSEQGRDVASDGTLQR